TVAIANLLVVFLCSLLQRPSVTYYHVSLLSSSCTLDLIGIYQTTHDITVFLPFHTSLYIQVPLHNLLHVQPFSIQESARVKNKLHLPFSFLARDIFSSFFFCRLVPFIFLLTYCYSSCT